MTKGQNRTLIIACGALAREIRFLIRANGLDHLELTCLPATLHNRPDLIPEAVRSKIRSAREDYDRIYCAYADCGTGGALDRVLATEQVSRIEGPHCYAFFSGQDEFTSIAEAEPGTFYLTDYLARQFESLIMDGMGLTLHPELLETYFGNYRKLVYFSQTVDEELVQKAKDAATKLGLEYEQIHTGMGELAGFVDAAAKGEGAPPSMEDHPKATTEMPLPLPGSAWRRSGAKTRGRQRGHQRGRTVR